MNSLNHVLLEGRLTRDPQLDYIGAGTAKCTISIAVNSSYKPKGAAEYKQEVEYFDLVCWREQAENAGSYLKKGRLVRVVGKLKQDRWRDSTTGTSRSKVYVLIGTIEYGPQPKEGGETGSARRPAEEQGDPPPPAGSEADTFDDDIPF